MSNEITIDVAGELERQRAAPKRVHHPVQAYVEQLNGRSKQTVMSLLDTAAAIAEGIDISTRELREAVRGIAMERRLWRLSRAEVGALLQRMIDLDYAPATVNLTLAGLRGVMREAQASGLISHEVLTDVLRAKRVRGSRLARGRMIAPHELQALTAAAEQEDGSIGLRDLSLIGMVGGGGLRRFEACSVEPQDFDQASGTLRVIGKNNKEREVPLPPTPAAWIARWLVARGNAPGTILVRLDRAAKRLDLPLSPNGVYARVARLAVLAGIDPAPRPHDFRRTFISEMLRRTDVFTVAKLAGHSQIETTRTYDLRPKEEAAKAVALLDDIFKKGNKT